MNSYKQRILDAQLDLIRRYEKNDPPEICPFCEIYFYDCRGCFLTGQSSPDDGCVRFKSFLPANHMSEYSRAQRLARAKFHCKVRKMLLKRPARYFTPSGWKYLDIPREW